MELFGVPPQVLFGQLLLGLINGSFYALLSLGLAIIFGLLNVINFAHGALYMVGAFTAFWLLNVAGIPYWGALLVAPLIVGALRRRHRKNHVESALSARPPLWSLAHLRLGADARGTFSQHLRRPRGVLTPIPEALAGGQNLGFMFLPNYRAWVIVSSLVVCFGTWFVVERTRLGSYLRAGTENPALVRAFGVNVPLLMTLTYGFGVALAGFAGVLAAPIYQVNPLMGSDIIIVVFAIVVIGGMGSILGAIVTGLGVGVVEGLTKTFYPELSATVIFIVMAIVLLLKPAGLFGRER